MTTLVRVAARNGQQATVTRDLAEAPWKPLYRVAGGAALLVVGLIPVQLLVYILWPPPATALGYFRVFHDSALIGLLNQDLLLVVDEVLMALVMLGLYVALRRASQPFMAIALTLGLLGTALFLTSNTAFNMLALSDQYAAATTDAQRAATLAAGQAMLAIYQGTAFNAGYVLTAAADLIFGVVMLRGGVFGKATAIVAILAGATGLVPPTAGTVGLAFSFLSIVPLVAWQILIGRRLWQLGRGTAKGEEHE